MKKKVIFLDVDGTLINYRTIMPKSAGEAVDMARANGHKVYVCTGCSKAEILQRNLCELDGMIGANGGYIESEGKVLYHKPLTVDQVRHVVDWCKDRGLGIILEANSDRYFDDNFLAQAYEVNYKYALGKGATEEEARKKMASKEEYEDALKKRMGYLKDEDLYRDDVNKISFVLSSYQDHLDSVKEFPDMEVHTWGGVGESALYGDCAPKGIDKKFAIELLCKELGVSKEDTISFGDAKIDISMFECCGYNVAMGNGGDEVKAAADYITDHVDNDGIYNAFVRLGLI